LAYEYAARHDGSVASGVKSGAAADREQATAEQIKALIEPPLGELDSNGSEALTELFDLALSIPAPKVADRRALAAQRISQSPSNVERRIEPLALERLTEVLIATYGDLFPADNLAAEPQPEASDPSSHPQLLTRSLKRPRQRHLAIGLGLILMAALAIVIPSLVSRHTPTHEGALWGPARSSFSWSRPSSFVTLDSITDNPVAGDERQFLTAYRHNSLEARRSLVVHDKEDIVLRAYFENDAAPNLKLIATDSRIAIKLPGEAATKQVVTGFIGANNARPSSIWSSVSLVASRPFYVLYSKGSARLWNNTTPGTFWDRSNGLKLNDQIATAKGVPLGCGRHLDGILTGDISNCAGWVTIHLYIAFA
jgi:predicted secreted protein